MFDSLENMIKFLIIFGLFFNIIMGKMDQFQFDINDILDEKFMPASLFLLQGEIDPNLPPELNVTSEKIDGKFTDALETMGFHRQMMNKYLCNNFVAKQIITDILPETEKLERRMGTVSISNESINELRNLTNNKLIGNTPKEELRFDEGSSGYKDWLKKTTTLEDINQQLATKTRMFSGNRTGKNQRGTADTSFNRRQSYENDSNDFDDDYEEGEVTGYAIHHQPMQEYYTDDNNQQVNEPTNHFVFPHPTAGSKNGQNFYFDANTEPELNYISYKTTPKLFPNYPTSVGAPSPPSSEGYYPSAPGGGYDDYGVQNNQQTKEIGLKDIMDIALTTLAFLSFGMFILQVLMCITMSNPDNNNNMMMMPMEMEMTPDDGTEEIRRKRRSIMPDDYVKQINEISRKVLVSIDSAIHVEHDDGQCLHHILCHMNSYAREQKDGRKIWFPVWSLGLSWLSSRFASAQTQTTAILSSLKAATLGLGNANCTKAYPDCDYAEMEHAKRRKKRNTGNKPYKWNN